MYPLLPVHTSPTHQDAQPWDRGEEPQRGFRRFTGQLHNLQRMEELQELAFDGGTHLWGMRGQEERQVDPTEGTLI